MIISRSFLAIAVGFVAMLITCGYLRFMADSISKIFGSYASFLLAPIVLYFVLLLTLFGMMSILSVKELLGAWPGIIVGVIFVYLPHVAFLLLYQTGYWKI